MNVQIAPPVPTVPTVPSAVGTEQLVDIVGCSDHSDRSDQNDGGSGGKKKSLSGLVYRLRQSRERHSRLETRHVLIPSFNPSLSTASASHAVGTVGAVGTVNESGAFGAVERSEQGSEQSEHPCQAAAEPVERSELPPLADADWVALETSRRRDVDADAGVLTELGRTESLAPMQAEAGEASCQVGDLNPKPITRDVPQTIPHETMLAGLRAVGGYWAPRAIGSAVIAEKSGQVGHSTEVDADPWATGVDRLQRMAPLAGFTVMQWERVQRGCASLLAEWGADMRRLGWSVVDAFGVHPDAPGAAVHAYGLGVLLGDGRVVDLTETGAQIETARGVRQSFRRKPMPWSVPVWAVGSGLVEDNPERALASCD